MLVDVYEFEEGCLSVNSLDFLIFLSLRESSPEVHADGTLPYNSPNPNLFSILLNYCESMYLWGFFAIQLCVFSSLLPTESFKSDSWLPLLDVGFIHEFVFPSNLPFINFDDILWPDREVPAVPKEGGGMEFLPLMLISLYCSVGIIGAWLRLSWGYFKR